MTVIYLLLRYCLIIGNEIKVIAKLSQTDLYKNKTVF